MTQYETKKLTHLKALSQKQWRRDDSCGKPAKEHEDVGVCGRPGNLHRCDDASVAIDG
jgi:hypothetical protein